MTDARMYSSALIETLKQALPAGDLKWRKGSEPPQAAMILLHGRGATAESILQLADYFSAPGMIYLAPQAKGNIWYPYPFTSPLDDNEPWLSHAMETVGGLVETLNENGISPERVIMAGFSQGACLAAEFCARNARRYGGLLVFSGGLIGPPGMPRDYGGSLDDTPVLIGCGERDPYFSMQNIRETAHWLEQLGGSVDLQIYPGMGHTINEDEIARSQSLIEKVLSIKSVADDLIRKV